jgi:ribosomal protein L11 methyltransferase
MNTNSTEWFWAKGSCPEEEFEIASYYLFEAGIASLEELERLEGRVNFRFFGEERGEMERICDEYPQYKWTIGAEENKDWDKHWKEQQHPIEVGPGLWVCPPWVEFTPPEGCEKLLLEAKMAFGTGQHESTRLMVELMDRAGMQDKKVLDIGAGTGILTMYALRRGAQRAWFTEIDPVTTPCIEENFALNKLAPAEGILGGLECLQGEGLVDMVLCNMIRTQMWPLRADILRLLQEGGEWVIAGQLEIQDKPLWMEWFPEAGLEVVAEAVQGEWWAATVKKTKN